MAAIARAAVTEDQRDVAAPTREARRLQYLLVRMQEAHVDRRRVPAGQLGMAILSPYERLGYSTQDIESWVGLCDPETKPSWDQVACFRERVKAALKPKPSLGMRVTIVGGAAFIGAFLLARRAR